MPPRVLPTTNFLDLKLGSLDLHLEDFRLDLGSVDHRRPDGTGTATIGEQDTIELDRLTSFRSGTVIDRQLFAGRNPVLATSIDDDGKHGNTSRNTDRLWDGDRVGEMGNRKL